MFYLKSSFIGLVGAAVVLLTGCSPQSKRPNQINAFDGATYDSLTAAHAALAGLHGPIASQYPQYISAYNAAAASYTVAYNAYATYRTELANQAAVSVALGNLTLSIVTLENTIQAELPVSAETIAQTRTRVLRLRAAAEPEITLSSILTELEIAASIAETVPGTAPYAELAVLVINATRDAVAAITATSNQPIDLSLIQPIPAI